MRSYLCAAINAQPLMRSYECAAINAQPLMRSYLCAHHRWVVCIGGNLGQLVLLQENAALYCFECRFPYVCPEPVLVN